MMEIREILCAKDTKNSYSLFLQMEAQAGESEALFAELPLYLEMLSSPSSYIRVRGFRMICASAKWDSEGKIAENLPAILAGLEDEKPTAVRQCLAALPRLLSARPELTGPIRDKMSSLDLSGYKDTMQPLIRRDIEKLLHDLQG